MTQQTIITRGEDIDALIQQGVERGLFSPEDLQLIDKAKSAGNEDLLRQIIKIVSKSQMKFELIEMGSSKKIMQALSGFWDKLKSGQKNNYAKAVQNLTKIEKQNSAKQQEHLLNLLDQQ